MSRWSHENDLKERICIRDAEDRVSVVVSSMADPKSEEDESCMVFSLSPDKAREMAAWLCRYASSAEVALVDAPASESVWRPAPQPRPEGAPTAAERREAYSFLVTSSRLNITELGAYPPGMTLDEALSNYDDWAEWARAVLEFHPEENDG